MKLLKGILEEELERCRRLKKSYDRELTKLPKGSLVRKKIKEWQYYYLIYRDESGVVCSDYWGRASEETLKKYEQAKEQRVHYRRLRSDLRKEIQLLERTLQKKVLQCTK